MFRGGRVYSKKVKADGITFDSQMEYDRYCELKQRQDDKEISKLKTHPAFELQPEFEKDGKKYAAVNYEADFQYEEKGKVVIEDVKGFLFADFALKEKWFEFTFPEYNLSVLTKYKGDFVDFDYAKKAKSKAKRDRLKKLRDSIKTLEKQLKSDDILSKEEMKDLPLMKNRPQGKVKNQLNKLKHKHWDLTVKVKADQKEKQKRK